MPTPANAQTMAIFDEIRAAFPGRFRFTSGLRSARQNAAVGGEPDSYHLTGYAVDFVPVDGRFPAGELEAIASVVARHGYEVIKHRGTGWHYHIEPAPGGQSAASNSEPGTPNSELMLYGLGLLFLLLIT